MRLKLNQRNLKPIMAANPAPQDITDTEIKGFSLRIGKTKNSFRLNYTNQASERKVFIIGSYPAITADSARKAAQTLLARISLGEDPQSEKSSAKAEATRIKNETGLAYLENYYSGKLKRDKTGDYSKRVLLKDFKDLLAKPMSTLKKSDLVAWQAQQESTGIRHETIARKFSTFSAMLSHAVSLDILTTNPIKGFKLERPALSEEDLAGKADSRRALTADEQAAFFYGIEQYQKHKQEQRRNSRTHGKAHLADLDNVAYVNHVAPFLLLMFYTGFRNGDLFGLRWEHVNINFKTIRKIIEKTAHHNSELVTFPISDAAIDVLKAWHNQQGKPSTGYVFPSTANETKGERMDKGSMQTPWKHVRELGGLSDKLVMYSLRHNFASQLVLAGVDLYTVSRLMGHADINTTIDNYAHLQPDKAREHINAFAQSAKFIEQKSKKGLQSEK